MQPWLAAPATLLLLVLTVYCHRNWLGIFPEDPPGTGRHHHGSPMPMAGWVPTVLVVAALAWWGVSTWIYGGIALASLAGWLDDRGKSEGREMTWRVKGVLLAIATVLVLAGQVTSHASGSLTLDTLVIAFLWLFAVTNAVNFLDNTDGVAASLGALGLLLISRGEGVLAVAGFAYLGFLPANWPKPRVFLGDSGSLGLGLCLASASLGSLDRTFSWQALAPITLIALDFSQVILARLILGVPPWLGDRRHLTHIAVHLGLPRVLVAPLFAATTYAIYQFFPLCV